MGHFTFGLVCATLFTSATALYPLIPEGKELIYHYHGVIGAGTDTPASYASSIGLDGNVHLQTDSNSSYVHFSELRYKLHNGEQDWWHEFQAKELELPKELEVLQHPFKVVYEPCGHALGIVVSEGEPQWSVNIKRGLASMLQLYTDKIQWDSKSPYAFDCKERTLYGKGQTYYTVYPENDHWTVKKMAEPHNSYHLYAHLWTNARMSACEARFDEPLTRDSMQSYNIITKDGQHVIESIDSDGGLTYFPHEGESVGYHIYMNQSLVLKKIEPSTELYTIENPKFYHGLTYYYGDVDKTEVLMDVFHGRKIMDMDKLLVKLEEMLYENMKYMKENHMDMEKPDWARTQLLNSILVTMHYLDHQHLEAMTDKLLQKTGDEDKDVLHIYYHMLPMIGTQATFTYMTKLIKAKKIKDKLALEWLQNMPFYVKTPTKHLVEDMQDMLSWGDEISADVRNAAILAFGNLIEKAVFRYNKLNHINHWAGDYGHENTDNFTPDYEMGTHFPGPEYYNTYVAQMVEKLEAADNLGTRSAFISALHNTRLENAIPPLWTIAKGELWDDNYLRLLALKGLSALISPHKEELIYKVFWPLMSDYNLSTNLRVAAYLSIMHTRPSLQRMMNIYWQMANEVNPAFYRFHYTYLQSIAHTTDPCLENFRTIVKQIMRYTEKIEYPGLTGVHAIDYMDTKYEYGHQVNGWLVHTPIESPTTFKLSLDSTVEKGKFPLHQIIVHIDGLDASIFDDISLYVNDPHRALNFEKVWKAYQNIYNNKDIQINMVLFNYNQIVMSYNYNASNIKDFSKFLDFFIADKFSYIKKYFSIVYPLQSHILMPTDMGFLGLYKIYLPKAMYFDLKINKDVINNMITYQFDGIFKEWVNGQYGLSFYNPFSDAFHGVHRMQMVEISQPLYFDLSLNPGQQSMKLSWKRHQDPVKDTLAYKSYAATYTFVRDDSNSGLLQTSNPKAKNWEMVTVNDHQDDHILYASDNPNTGSNVMLAQFGSDAYMPNVSIYNHMSFLHHSENCNTWLGHRLLQYFHVTNHFLWQPQPAANGLIWRVQPSKLYPVTNIDINLRLSKEYKPSDWLLTPATKYNLRTTYAVHNNDAITRSWDVNVILDEEVDHTTSNMKAIISRIIPGQKEWRVCLDAAKTFTSEGVDIVATVAMTHSSEPKCTKDEKVMDIKVKAEKLPEQIENKHIYGECYEKMWSDIHEQNSLDCYYARDSLRKWTYEYDTYNMPTEFKRIMQRGYDWMQSRFLKYLTMKGEASLQLGNDSWKIVHEYPLIGNKVDVHVYTHDNDYKFGGIPGWKSPYYQFHMSHTQHFSPLFRVLHRIGWTKMCEIHETSIVTLSGKSIMTPMPEDWTMYVGAAETDAKHGIWAKKVGKEAVALKMVHGDHVFEIQPKGHNIYEVTIDGKKLPADTYQHGEKWIWVDWVKETGVISVVSILSGSHILYDGHHILIESPNFDMQLYGHCV